MATIERASTVVSPIIYPHERSPASISDSLWRICLRPYRQPGEGQLFTGAEITAKDVDCVLVYDEELGVRPSLCSELPINT